MDEMNTGNKTEAEIDEDTYLTPNNLNIIETN